MFSLSPAGLSSSAKQRNQVWKGHGALTKMLQIETREQKSFTTEPVKLKLDGGGVCSSIKRRSVCASESELELNSLWFRDNPECNMNPVWAQIQCELRNIHWSPEIFNLNQFTFTLVLNTNIQPHHRENVLAHISGFKTYDFLLLTNSVVHFGTNALFANISLRTRRLLRTII